MCKDELWELTEQEGLGRVYKECAERVCEGLKIREDPVGGRDYIRMRLGMGRILNKIVMIRYHCRFLSKITAKNALGKQFFFSIFSVHQRWQRPEAERGRVGLGNDEDKDWSAVHAN